MALLKVFSRTRSTSVVALKIQGSSPTLLNSMDSHQLSLSNEDLSKAVKLPQEEKLNDWIASHVADFYNKIGLLVDSLKSECTEKNCPIMSAGAAIEYRWVDKHNPEYKSPKSVPAPKYCTLLLSWIHKQLNNESIFPTNPKNSYGKKFSKIVKKSFSRIFRVFAHLYCTHVMHIKKNGLLAHLNTTFKHFMLFVFEFDLVDKSEFVPLNDLIIQLLGEEYKKKLSLESAKMKIDFSYLNKF